MNRGLLFTSACLNMNRGQYPGSNLERKKRQKAKCRIEQKIRDSQNPKPISHPIVPAYFPTMLPTLAQFKQDLTECFREAITHTRSIGAVNQNERRGMFVTSLNQVAKRLLGGHNCNNIKVLLSVKTWRDMGVLCDGINWRINFSTCDGQSSLDVDGINKCLKNATNDMKHYVAFASNNRNLEPQDAMEVDIHQLTSNLDSLESKLTQLRRLNEDADRVFVDLADILRSV